MSSLLWHTLKVSCLAALLSLSAAARADTLFEDIGGEPKLKAAVAELVNVILADERINFTFAGADLERFKTSLYNQLCELAGGPCIYDGRSMRDVHQKLPITNTQFNALAEDLYIAFDRVGVSYRAQNRMVALLAPMQKDIVRKK